jgi:magnesium transporter
MDEFNIHPTVAEELLVPSFKSKVDKSDEYLYLILHFPTFGSRLSGSTQEVDFIVGKNFIVTTRYGSIDPFMRFEKIFEAHSILDKATTPVHAGSVFLFMLRSLYQALDSEIEYLNHDLVRIEEKIFAGKERDMVFELSHISRALITFKQSLLPHGSMLDSLEAISVRFFGQEFSYSLKGALSDYSRVIAALSTQHDILLELRDTNNSLLTTKQNETAKHLTMMAFVTFPLTLLVGIFGMNTSYMPIIGSTYDFWIIIAIMAAMTGSFFLFFKHKKWL